MSYSMEHKRMKPVLDLARKLDIATNPEPDALYEAGSGGFQIWCSPDDHPEGWEGVPMNMGAFAQPCAFVGSVIWGWEGEKIAYLELETEAYDLRGVNQRPPGTRNRPEDVSWASEKIRRLFEQAGVTCPSIRVGGEVLGEAPQPSRQVLAREGVDISLEKESENFRIVVKFDKPEAKGTLVLEECAYGFYLYCPQVHAKDPVAILDLFYASPEAEKCEVERAGLPLVIGLFSPGQSEDPLGSADCFPKGTRVQFDVGAREVKGGDALHEKEFGLAD